MGPTQGCVISVSFVLPTFNFVFFRAEVRQKLHLIAEMGSLADQAQKLDAEALRNDGGSRRKKKVSEGFALFFSSASLRLPLRRVEHFASASNSPAIGCSPGCAGLFVAKAFCFHNVDGTRHQSSARENTKLKVSNTEISESAVATAQRLLRLFAEDGKRIQETGRIAGSVLQVHHRLHRGSAKPDLCLQPRAASVIGGDGTLAILPS